uniref:Gag-Pol polyprotein n=1 Tax=Tanacetum cinerariifolium TaxID=118510 RepID=A0A699GZF7_TANCI|nr:hypothetical protein [Tanacetum cinerariifolium]
MVNLTKYALSHASRRANPDTPDIHAGDPNDEIYSIVDAWKITQEMWATIERLQQGESMNKQDVKTNLFWEFGKFTSRGGESIESYYSRFYKMMNQMEYGHFAKECRKPKLVKDYAYHKEKMMMFKQEEKGVTLSAEQSGWLQDTDEEADEQELEEYYMYMEKIQEIPHITYENFGPTYDTKPLE